MFIRFVAMGKSFLAAALPLPTSCDRSAPYRVFRATERWPVISPLLNAPHWV